MPSGPKGTVPRYHKGIVLRQAIDSAHDSIAMTLSWPQGSSHENVSTAPQFMDVMTVAGAANAIEIYSGQSIKILVRDFNELRQHREGPLKRLVHCAALNPSIECVILSGSNQIDSHYEYIRSWLVSIVEIPRDVRSFIGRYRKWGVIELKQTTVTIPEFGKLLDQLLPSSAATTFLQTLAQLSNQHQDITWIAHMQSAEERSIKKRLDQSNITRIELVVPNSQGPEPETPPKTSSILIVTVTKVEAQAVLNAFSAAGKERTRQPIGNKTYYNLGVHGGAPIFMVQSEMGTATPGGALLTVRHGIQDLRPQAVIMCGVAFGLRPGKQQLGDILVAKQLQYYEPQKVDLQRGQTPRGDRTTATERLLDRFRSGDIDWNGPQVHFGLVLSGEKLVNDPTFRDRLLEAEPEAIGGEMEGAGLYAAARDANIEWILVKAICDWGDGTKNDNAQQQAADNAARFVLHVLLLGGWSEVEQSPTNNEPDTAENAPPRGDKVTRHYLHMRIRNVFAQLFDTIPDTKRIINDIGLASEQIAWGDGKAVNFWYSIVEEVAKHNLIEALLQKAMEPDYYPNYPELRATWQLYSDWKQQT